MVLREYLSYAIPWCDDDDDDAIHINIGIAPSQHNGWICVPTERDHENNMRLVLCVVKYEVY